MLASPLVSRSEMPFLKRHDHDDFYKAPGHENDPEILLRQTGPNAFQLMEGFDYRVPGSGKLGGEKFPAPPHDLRQAPDAEVPTDDASVPMKNSTDLASVPFILWWFIASHGRHTRAALLHDHLVDADKIVKRRDADTVLRLALEESDVKWLRRWLMWAAVSLASNAKSWWGRLYVLVFCAFLLAYGWALLFWAFAPSRWLPFDSVDRWPLSEHGSLPWGGEQWLPALIVAVAGLWGARRWLLGLLAVPLLGPPTVFVLVALGAVAAVNVLATPFVWVLSGAAFRGERPERPDLIPRPYRHQTRRF